MPIYNDMPHSNFKYIDRGVLQTVRTRQNKIESMCSKAQADLRKIAGRTNSPLILDLVESVSSVVDSIREEADFRKWGMDLFFDEMGDLINRVDTIQQIVSRMGHPSTLEE